MFGKSGRDIVTFFVAVQLCHCVQGAVTISAGNYAQFGDFTHQVSLRTSDNQPLCSGALISDRWTLSTAACVTKNPKLIAVGVYTHQEADIYSCDAMKSHEQFNPTTFINDIGLFRANNQIFLYEYAQPIPYYKGTAAGCGGNVVGVGWDYVCRDV